MEIKALCQTLSKAFDMSRATAKVSPKPLKEDDQDSGKPDHQQSGLDGSQYGAEVLRLHYNRLARTVKKVKEEI